MHLHIYYIQDLMQLSDSRYPRCLYNVHLPFMAVKLGLCINSSSLKITIDNLNIERIIKSYIDKCFFSSNFYDSLTSDAGDYITTCIISDNLISVEIWEKNGTLFEKTKYNLSISLFMRLGLLSVETLETLIQISMK